MPANNKYLDSTIENFYRREAMHICIYVFIDTYKFLFNSITLQEAAIAFMTKYNIDDNLYSADTVIAIYYRVDKDLNDIQRHKDKLKAFPIKVNG